MIAVHSTRRNSIWTFWGYGNRKMLFKWQSLTQTLVLIGLLSEYCCRCKCVQWEIRGCRRTLLVQCGVKMNVLVWHQVTELSEEMQTGSSPCLWWMESHYWLHVEATADGVSQRRKVKSEGRSSLGNDVYFFPTSLSFRALRANITDLLWPIGEA